LHASEQDRPDVAEARKAWQASQAGLDPGKLVFIDETGAATNMVRRYGRAMKGQRLVSKAPHGHWKTITFTAALRSTSLTAPMVLDGPMDGQAFLAYVQQCLAPTLTPDDIVIMDNLPSHKVRGVKEAIAAAGARLEYLPAYSPDLNPIEPAFSKIKARLRKAAARSIQALTKAIARIIKTITPTECQNYFAHTGYSN
jgi:transposase